MAYPIFSHKNALELAKRFTRRCPKIPKYMDRLAHELNIIINIQAVDYLIRVYEISELTKDIPHIIRGSSGSSLVCYLLGITNFDPVEYDIIFERFMNSQRTTLPDVDFDFPSNRRAEVFSRIFKTWPGLVARISNHVKYQKKGALRKAIKDMGHPHRVPRRQLNLNFFGESKKSDLQKLQNNYIGQFKNYSLHVGGIIFLPNLPAQDMLSDTQIKYDKYDVESKKIYKIDILSSCALTQLFDISKNPIESYNYSDPLTWKLLQEGDNIGITFGESILVRRLLITFKPKNIKEIATCLAIIRPCSSANKNKITDENWEQSEKIIIFDDDAITMIQNLLNCDPATADKYRRGFAKNNPEKIREFNKKLKNPYKIKIANQKLSAVRKYSFCLSHSISYALLVYALAYQKAHNPKEFWLSCLNNCNSYYRDWVHYQELKKSGLKLEIGKKPYKIENNILKPINPPKNYQNNLSPESEYNLFGYWRENILIGNPYLKIISDRNRLIGFRGLIAIHRKYQKYIDNKQTFFTFITISYSNFKYIDLVIKKWISCEYYDYIYGTGTLKPYYKNCKFGYIEIEDYKLGRIKSENK